MKPLPETADLIVIGAGAAGLAAAARARSLGLGTLLLEAGPRIGGRCHTDQDSLGLPWDRGAHWMHQALSNPFVQHARARGRAWSDSPRKVRHWLADEGHWATQAEQQEIDAYVDSCYAAVEIAATAGREASLAEVMPPHPRWRAYAEGWLQAMNGGEVEEVSIQDYVRFEEDGANWPLQDGYGSLLAELHRDTAVELDTPAERVAWSAQGVTVTTPRGRVTAERAILALPTPVLLREDLFEPALPPEKRAAAAALPLGRHEKLALRFDEAALPEESHWYIHRVGRERAALNGIIRPFGRPMILLHLGGSLLRHWQKPTPADTLEPVLDLLEAMLERPLRPHLTGWSATNWGDDPRFGGSYSSARPGHADARQRLTDPLANKLFFAGEACNIPAFGTVHGAHASGIAAAEAVAQAAGLRISPLPA
ncbi:flavin monoamine oxidase family protein [Aquibaculum sediminis]|uniref:flavin monoamine oxidase family protein n=1 Tax=Aquibaculum sediminis TaxID=3231907 RepID=UPI003456EAB2